HGLPAEAQHHGIGHGDDLHHAAVDEPLDTLPDSRLGEPHRLADRRIRAPAILLQLLDDQLGNVVEHDSGSGGPAGPAAACCGGGGDRDDGSPGRMSHAVASFARAIVPCPGTSSTDSVDSNAICYGITCERI